MISEQQLLWNYPEQTSGASDFRDNSRARTSALRANRRACKKVSEADCFSRLCDCLPDCGKKIDPSGFSVKMLKIYLALETDLISQGCSLKWGGMGMIANGNCSTQKTLAFPKIGKGCSLLDILEDEVDEKYFLSPQQTAKILANCRS